MSGSRTARGTAGRRRVPPKPAPARRIAAALLRPFATHPATTLVIGGGIVLLGTIAVNALLLQEGPHPHPLFRAAPEAIAIAVEGGSADPGLADPGLAEPGHVDPALVRDIQVALADLGYYRGSIDGTAGPGTLAAAAAFEASSGGSGAPQLTEALLARLLIAAPAAQQTAAATPPAAVTVPPRHPPALTGAEPAPAKPGQQATPALAKGGSEQVMRLQKALADLGYGPLTVDGLVGSQTSAAIRRFRLDHGLPATGGVDQRLVETMVRIGGLPPG